LVRHNNRILLQMEKTKFYVVWKGKKPGIYLSWKDCQEQIFGYEGALYKSYPSRIEAESALKQNPYKHIGTKEKIASRKDSKGASGKIISESICVDAAWNTVTKVMEYRGVYTRTGEEIFHGGPYHDATNNIGEFLAIVHGLSLLARKKSSIPVYSDSHTAITWVKNKHAKTKLEINAGNAQLFNLIARAEKWLFEHVYDNKIIKWETTQWGEIPADFGRK
jgi:ribonuclease HI